MRTFWAVREEDVRAAVDDDVTVGAIEHVGGRWCEACVFEDTHPAQVRVTTITVTACGDGIRADETFTCFRQGMHNAIHASRVNPDTVCAVVDILNGTIAEQKRLLGDCFKCGISSDRFMHCPNCGRPFTYDSGGVMHKYHTQVLGRHVTGSVNRPEKRSRKPQWPGEKFIQILDELLKLSGVHSVRWEQCTPRHSVGGVAAAEPRVRLARGKGYATRYTLKRDSSAEAVYRALTELASAMPYFEEFLEDSFGDHAVVTATTQGFSVAFYDQD